MSIISNSNNFFYDQHFIFQENSILLEKTQNSAINIKITEEKSLPSESTVRKCLNLQVAEDWFSEPEYNYTAMQIESASPAPSGCELIQIREFFNLADDNLVMQVSRAKGLIEWRKRTRFCAKCATRLGEHQFLSAKVCPRCGTEFFPRIEPAVIVLVSDGDKLLLVRHAQRIQNLYACVSGFVEIGETPEQCVMREVKEETGISVKNIRYVGSQSWPFPDQLMLAYRAEYESGEILPQPEEIAEVAWFDKNNLPTIPKPGSVAHNLITGVFG